MPITPHYIWVYQDFNESADSWAAQAFGFPADAVVVVYWGTSSSHKTPAFSIRIF